MTIAETKYLDDKFHSLAEPGYVVSGRVQLGEDDWRFSAIMYLNKEGRDKVHEEFSKFIKGEIEVISTNMFIGKATFVHTKDFIRLDTENFQQACKALNYMS